VFRPLRPSWGTAIYSRIGALEELQLGRYPGRVAAASLSTGPWRGLHVASIHAPIIGGHVFPHLSHIFDDIEAAFANKPAVVGGDLNSARKAESVWPNSGHGPFFERMEAGELVDCHRKFHPEEVQTFFRLGTVNAFQEDHLFASKDVAEQVIECRVINNEITRRVSDHIPLVAEIAI
jgi:endonuclease/exonuclease/phosphatase family metal-dependent hydrolase